MRLANLQPKSLARLERYVALLEKWKSVTNLISDSALREIWSRHIPDGIRIFELFPTKLRWLDFGSGAGLPSVIIASLLVDVPEARVICVESDGRKCAFLRNVSRDLGIPLKVLNVRAEKIVSPDLGPIDMITARAFSSVQNIISLADPFLSLGAILILPRGESSRSEIEAIDAIRYEIAEHDGIAGSNGFFLEIRRRTGTS